MGGAKDDEEGDGSVVESGDYGRVAFAVCVLVEWGNGGEVWEDDVEEAELAACVGIESVLGRRHDSRRSIPVRCFEFGKGGGRRACHSNDEEHVKTMPGLSCDGVATTSVQPTLAVFIPILNDADTYAVFRLTFALVKKCCLS